MTTQLFGATSWLVLMAAACSSSSTTQNVISAPDSGVTGGKSNVAGSLSTGGLGAVGGAATSLGGGDVGGSTQSVGGAPNVGGASEGVGGQIVGGATWGGGTTSVNTVALTGGSTSTGGSQGIAGSHPVGGATATGGAATAGAATTGGVTGVATGGRTSTSTVAVTGGAAAGGAATGGRATGGRATGGAPTGGAATGGTPNQFANGPCITSPDLTSVQIFASSGSSIYRRVVTSATSTGSWAPVATLDATKLDITSDLDCTSHSSTVHLAASGSNPMGSYMHATGNSNGTFNAFARELSTNTPSTFGFTGASIAAWTDYTAYVGYAMAAVPSSGQPTWVTFDGTSYSSYTAPVDYSLNSAADIAYQRGNGDNPNRSQMVAFTGQGLVYFEYASGYGSYWTTNVYVPPPQGTTYQYSPTLCNHHDEVAGDYRRYIAAVANGTLYVAYSDVDWTNGTTFSAWQMAGSAAPASSPDCVVTSDNTVHIVVLTTSGTIAHVYRTGISGAWSTQPLGTY